jgi:hypothetical protein
MGEGFREVVLSRNVDGQTRVAVALGRVGSITRWPELES